MKAVLCKELGLPSALVIEEVESKKPGKKEVLIEVKACSVNYPDTLIIQGLYQFKPQLPFSPGSDIAGIVKEVGEEVKHLKPGQEVFGIVPHGGFAEEVIAPANSVFPKPAAMDFKVAAAFMMAYGLFMYLYISSFDELHTNTVTVANVMLFICNVLLILREFAEMVN